MRRVDGFVSANHTASSPGASSVDPALAVDPSDPGFARPASRRCGRLTLENLVLRGGFAEEAPGAAQDAEPAAEPEGQDDSPAEEDPAPSGRRARAKPEAAAEKNDKAKKAMEEDSE